MSVWRLRLPIFSATWLNDMNLIPHWPRLAGDFFDIKNIVLEYNHSPKDPLKGMVRRSYRSFRKEVNMDCFLPYS